MDFFRRKPDRAHSEFPPDDCEGRNSKAFTAERKERRETRVAPKVLEDLEEESVRAGKNRYRVGGLRVEAA